MTFIAGLISLICLAALGLVCYQIYKRELAIIEHKPKFEENELFDVGPSTSEADIEWEELMVCVENQYGFDLGFIMEQSDLLLVKETAENLHEQFGVDIGELLCNIRVHALVVDEETDVVYDCTLGG